MLEKTYYSSGKNNFKDCTFSSQEWSAPTMVSPGEIRKLIASFKLEGRKIRKLRMVGLSYMLTRDWIESHVYDCLAQYEEDERQRRSNYRNIDSEILFGCVTQIDEPFLIGFEGGDVFEIDTPQQPEFRMSMNCIPWEIDAGTNLPNVDANVLFAPCIGRTILNVEVRTYYSDKDPMFNNYFDKEHSERELVSNIVLWLDDGNGISIGGFIDYCEVAYINEDCVLHSIPFWKLKPGLFNWEDLHTDEIAEFVAESPSFFFGELGRNHAKEPFITLSPGEGKTSLHISYGGDFLLFDWSITCLNREFFDEYGDYEFSLQQWKEILDIATRIASFTDFDALFDHLVGLEIIYTSWRGGEKNLFRDRLNSKGVVFWDNREKYLTQLKDMRTWSEKVLSDDESMNVYGF